LSLPDLYLDEDVQSSALIQGLRARVLSVLTTTEAEMTDRTDEEQLCYATSRKRVLVSCNIADFSRLHANFIRTAREHTGIILVHQQRWGPGELARRILRLLAAMSDQGFRNRLEFLSRWG
jgi:Domain of unknown function (DUF5615)